MKIKRSIMKYMKTYENFSILNQEGFEELNEGKVTQKSFKNAAKKLKKGESSKKLIHTIAKGLTDYKTSINAGLKKVLNDVGASKYYNELNKVLVDTRALKVISLDQEKLKDMIEKYEELGGDKIDNMIDSGDIWKFKFPKYKDEINWDKSMNIVREESKKGHILIDGLEKKDDDIVLKVSSTKLGGPAGASYNA